MKINVARLKKLAVMCPNVVKHFCRSAARLHGLIAFREQLNLAETKGQYRTIPGVEVEMEDIKKSIAQSAVLCGNILVKLNAYGQKNNIGNICPDIENANLSDIIEAINTYQDELVSLSDFRSWIDEVA